MKIQTQTQAQPQTPIRTLFLTLFLAVFALLILTACGKSNSSGFANFTSNALTIDTSFGEAITEASTEQEREDVARIYLQRISFPLPLDRNVRGYLLNGPFPTDVFPNANTDLGAESGFFIIDTYDIVGSDYPAAHIYAGRLPTTDVGANLTANADFDIGAYSLSLRTDSGGDNYSGDFTVMASFTDNTITGESSGDNGATLTIVNGAFDGGAISGSVSATARGRTVTAPLSGVIGQAGVVGVFHSAGPNYAFGGGFIAESATSPTSTQ